MKNITQSLTFFLLISILTFTTSCGKEDISPTDFGIFLMQDENTVVVNGVIDSDTPQHWDNFIAANPNVTKMIMKDCPGSNDDEANLKAARKIREQGIAIHLPAAAAIASGAVDLFLAGTTRTREAGSKIGVHSWATGDNKEATDFPVGDAAHQLYIDYYREMGFSQADAENFYYFTINAAKAADIHWMTDAEIETYKLLTE
ncbi:MAG: alpha/beta hydrolase [Saprospiraceae bacterium]